MIIRERLKNVNWEPLDLFHNKIQKYIKKNMNKILFAADELTSVDKQILNNKASAMASEESFWMNQCQQYAKYMPSIDFNTLYDMYYIICLGAEVNYGKCKDLLSELIEAHVAIRTYVDDNFSDIILRTIDDSNQQE